MGFWQKVKFYLDKLVFWSWRSDYNYQRNQFIEHKASYAVATYDLEQSIKDLELRFKAMESILFENQKELVKGLSNQITSRQYMASHVLSGLMGAAIQNSKGIEDHLSVMALRFTDRTLQQIGEAE